MGTTYDSIILAGVSVGIVVLTESELKWSPRHEGDGSPKEVPLAEVLRSSWAPIGKSNHLRLFLKSGERLRFDGFRRTDIDGLSSFFSDKDIEFEKEKIASGGNNFGTLAFEGSRSLVMSKGGAQVFELDLTTVSQCVTAGNKQDELDIQFADTDTTNREDQAIYSMRLWVPDQEATAYQSKVLAHVDQSLQSSPVLVEFEREQGTFITPKNRYRIEMHDTFLRMHGASNDFIIKYSDIGRYYMLEKPTGRSGDAASFFYFVICLDKPVRQGQQKYPILVWQCQSEDTEVYINLDEESMEEQYPGSDLKPTMEGNLHKLIAKVFKVLTKKTVLSGSRKYSSADGNKCVSCNLGQRNGTLYPNDRTFIFLHQPTLIIEHNDIDYVEFVKAPQTRNFEFIIQKKSSGGETGKKYKFGGIEKKEFNALAEFVKGKEAFFTVRDFEPEAAEEDDISDDEEDEDFNSADESPVESSNGEDSDEEGEDDGAGEARPKKHDSEQPKKRKMAKSSPAPVKSSPALKKAKKDKNAPKTARSAYQLWSNFARQELKEKSPDMSFTEVGRELGSKWKELSAEDKQPWQEKADQDKKRHADEMLDYVPPEVDSDDGGRAKGKKKLKKEKDPNAPKKPLSAYFIWMGQERATIKEANPDATIGELGKLMGEKWKSMSDEDKSPYNEKALAAKEDYKMKVAEYERSKTETVASEESAPVKEEGDSDEEAEEDDVDDDDED